MQSNPSVAVVIVTADSGASLHACVRQALQQPEVSELWIVDNASRDGVPAQVLAAHAGDQRVHGLNLDRNYGFGAAVNRGAARTQADYLLVLNPDCLMPAGSLGQLLADLLAEPRLGAVGAVICDEDGRPDPASRRHDPLLARALASLLGRGEGIHQAGEWRPELIACEAISGALMLLPRTVWTAIQGFDEAYFLHCEDLDLCRRIRDQGYQVCVDGAVRVEHAKGGSSRHRPVFVSWHKHRGMWRWFSRYDPAASRPWLAVSVYVGIWVHFLLGLPARVRSGWSHRRGRASP